MISSSLFRKSRCAPLATAALGTLALSLIALTPARADILFFTERSTVKDLENVQFNGPGLITSGTTVTGRTNQTNTLVTFTNPISQETLVASGGQASIDSVDGSFTSLMVQLNSGLSFLSFEANPDVVAEGTVNLVVTEFNGMVNNFSFDAKRGGQNAFSFQAINGQRISSVLLSTTANNLADVKQVRLGGIGPNPTAPVPEPGMVAFLAVNGIGMTGMMFRARRRAGKRSTNVAA